MPKPCFISFPGGNPQRKGPGDEPMSPREGAGADLEDWSCDSSAFAPAHADAADQPRCRASQPLPMKHRAGRATSAWDRSAFGLGAGTKPSPFPRAAGLRHDRPLTQAQRVAAQLLTTQGPQRLRLRHRRRLGFVAPRAALRRQRHSQRRACAGRLGCGFESARGGLRAHPAKPQGEPREAL